MNILIAAISLATLVTGGIAQAAGTELLFSDNYNLSGEAQVLFSDSFDTSAVSNDVNFENVLRQSGADAPLTYSRRPVDEPGQPRDGFSSVTGPSGTPPGALQLLCGYDYSADTSTWVSPNRDFIRSGQTQIDYRVSLEDSSQQYVSSTVLFGSSYQGTDFGESRPYYTGEGNAFKVYRYVTGNYWGFEALGQWIWGGAPPAPQLQDGYNDVRIVMDNNGANSTVNIWLNGVKIIDNFARGYGYANNYVSLMSNSGDSWGTAKYDDFVVSAYQGASTAVNLQNSVRQSGSVAPLTYSRRPVDEPGQPRDGFSSLTGPSGTPPGALHFISGNDSSNDQITWVSPDYDFMRLGRTEITYKVKANTDIPDSRSIVMFGSSYQGTMWGWTRCYWEGDGNDLMLWFPQSQWMLELWQSRLEGTFIPHEGYYDVKIQMNNSGTRTTVNIWLDGVKIVDNFQRLRGYTNNYVSLAAFGGYDGWGHCYYDDFSVTAEVGEPMTLQQARVAPESTVLLLTGVIASAAFPNGFYVETADRSCGMRVDNPNNQVAAGTVVDIVGQIQTDWKDERFIAASKITPTGQDSIKPVGMNGRSLGGGDLGDPGAGQGQVGVLDGAGMNNIGLLVKAWGKVIYMYDEYGFADQTRFKLDDGSGRDVRVMLPEGAYLPTEGGYVAVTGASSLDKHADGTHTSQIFPQSVTDIVGILP